jgi:hypothetical protein
MAAIGLDALGGLLSFRFVASSNDRVKSSPGELPRHLEADPPICTSDESDAAFIVSLAHIAFPTEIIEGRCTRVSAVPAGRTLRVRSVSFKGQLRSARACL